MSSIEENLKKYYSSKSLHEYKIELLLGGKSSWKIPLRGYVAVVIVLFALIMAGFFRFPDNKLEMNVIKEIAMNHSKQLAVEYGTDDLGLLETRLVKLDFPLMPANEFIASNYVLLGGRYCSIQGNLAAQLKIKNLSTDKVETLYISQLNGDLNKINPSDINMDGVKITIWKKDGLLYGKASDN